MKRSGSTPKIYTDGTLGIRRNEASKLLRLSINLRAQNKVPFAYYPLVPLTSVSSLPHSILSTSFLVLNYSLTLNAILLLFMPILTKSWRRFSLSGSPCAQFCNRVLLFIFPFYFILLFFTTSKYSCRIHLVFFRYSDYAFIFLQNYIIFF